MQFSLEFQLTLTDLLQLASDRLSRWSLIGRRVIAVFVFISGLYHLRTSGLDWYFGLLVVCAIMLAVPFGLHGLLLWLWRPVVHVSIGDESICRWSKKCKQDIPWSSFGAMGSATESETHFLLECGRDAVWIPKRAFQTVVELAAFRQLVIDKMGDRCKFNTGQHEHSRSVEQPSP